MTDIEHLRRRVDEVYEEVRTLRAMSEVSLRSRKEEIAPVLLALFEGKDGPTLAKVYVAADGVRTQTQMATLAGHSQSTVSDALNKLREASLIEFVPRERGFAYKRNHVYDEVFGLSRILSMRFGIEFSDTPR